MSAIKRSNAAMMAFTNKNSHEKGGILISGAHQFRPAEAGHPDPHHMRRAHPELEAWNGPRTQIITTLECTSPPMPLPLVPVPESNRLAATECLWSKERLWNSQTSSMRSSQNSNGTFAQRRPQPNVTYI